MGVARVGRYLVVGIAVGAVLTACGSSTTSGSAGVLPSIAPATSGFQLAYLGDMSESAEVGGVKTAMAQYAKQHPNGPKVSIVYEDSKGDATVAVPLAYAIIADPTVIGLIGPGYSGESAAVNPMFNTAGLPEISQSATNATLTETGWKTFHRLVANDAAQGAAGAKVIKEAGKTRAFLIDDSEAYGNGLVGYVRAGLGKDVAGTYSVQIGQTDFSSAVTEVQAAKADAVYYGGYYQEAGLLVKQLRAAGWKGLFVSGDGTEDPHFVSIAGAAANGAVLTNAAGPSSPSFTAMYKAANKGQEPGANSEQSYDATNIFLQGILAGDTTRAKMEAFVNSYSGTGASGPIKFDADGDIVGSAIWAFHVIDGKLDPNQATLVK